MVEVRPELVGRPVHLADQEGVAGRLAQRRQGGAERRRPVVGVAPLERGRVGGLGERRRPGRGRVVEQVGVLAERVDRVHAEPVHAPAEPGADDVLHRRDHLRVAPVEVGLLRIERVQVPAAAALVPRPRRPAERRPPVVRRRVGPDVPVGVLAEPGVLDRGVVGDEVEQEPQPPAVRLGDQLGDIVQAPEAGVDAGEVGDVVAAVGQRRGIHGREPERVDAECGEIVQPAHDPADVADPVAVGVLEGAGVDLVDDRVGPPLLNKRGQTPFVHKRSTARALPE